MSKKYFFLKYIIISLILISILLSIIDVYTHWEPIQLYCKAIPSGDKNDLLPMDPVRLWPSGVPQSMAIIGTALATYTLLSRVPAVNARTRVLASLAGAGVSGGAI